jgi:MFS family permease
VCKDYFADQTLLDPNNTYPPVLLGSDNPQCKLPEVQRSVTWFMLVLTLCTGCISAYVAPKFGHLSDRFGRRRLLAMASTGGLLNELVCILAVKYPNVIHYRWLLLGAVFDGLTGSFTAGSILSQSYMSDCTPPSKRAVFMGYIHACLYTGLALGPLLAGYFVTWTGSLVSIFYVAISAHTFFILFVGFVIPESLSKRKRQASAEAWQKEVEQRRESGITWLSALQQASPFAPLVALWPRGPGTSPKLRLNLVVLAVSDMIIMGSAMASGAVIVIYAESTFGWGTLETSQFVSALSTIKVVVLMGVLPLINYFFRILPNRRRQASGVVVVDRNAGADVLDLWILRIALVSDIMGYVGYVCARSASLFVLSGATTALGGLGSATALAVVTKHVPPERVGQVLGAMGMLQALARVIGPLAFNSLYAVTVKTFPQAIFVLLACLFGTALVFSFALTPHVHWEVPEEEETDPLITGEEILPIGSADLPTAEEQVAFGRP